MTDLVQDAQQTAIDAPPPFDLREVEDTPEVVIDLRPPRAQHRPGRRDGSRATEFDSVRTSRPTSCRRVAAAADRGRSGRHPGREARRGGGIRARRLHRHLHRLPARRRTQDRASASKLIEGTVARSRLRPTRSRSRSDRRGGRWQRACSAGRDRGRHGPPTGSESSPAGRPSASTWRRLAELDGIEVAGLFTPRRPRLHAGALDGGEASDDAGRVRRSHRDGRTIRADGIPLTTVSVGSSGTFRFSVDATT